MPGTVLRTSTGYQIPAELYSKATWDLRAGGMMVAARVYSA